MVPNTYPGRSTIVRAASAGQVESPETGFRSARTPTGLRAPHPGEARTRRASPEGLVARFPWLSSSISSLVSSHSRANLELLLAEAGAEARASSEGSLETMDGQPSTTTCRRAMPCCPPANKIAQAPAPRRRRRRGLRRGLRRRRRRRERPDDEAVNNDPEIGNVGRRSAAKTPTIVVSLLDDQGYADVLWPAGRGDASGNALADALRRTRRRRREKLPHLARLHALAGHASHREAPRPAGHARRCWPARRPRSRRTSRRSASSREGAAGRLQGHRRQGDLGAASPKYVPTARGFDAFTGFYNAMINILTGLSNRSP